MRAVDNALELILFLFLVVFSVFGEGVKQMVDDLGAENAHAETVSHLLRISLYFHIKRQDHCIPTERESEWLAWYNPIIGDKLCITQNTYCWSCSNIVEAFMTSFLWTGPMLMPAYWRTERESKRRCKQLKHYSSITLQQAQWRKKKTMIILVIK